MNDESKTAEKKNGEKTGQKKVNGEKTAQKVNKKTAQQVNGKNTTEKKVNGEKTAKKPVGFADLPEVGTFIAFDWLDYHNKRDLKRKCRWKRENFTLGEVVSVCLDEDDPALESIISVHVWGQPPGSNQYTGEYLRAWLHDKIEKQTMHDPSTATEEYKLWEKDVFARHIITLDVCMKPSDSGPGDASPLIIAPQDQEDIKRDLVRYNAT
eukprot:g43219.t1